MEFTTNNLELDHTEENVWLDGNIEYFDCQKRFFMRFHNVNDLENELKRPDINSVCRKELNNLRSNVDTIKYRDVLGKRNDYFRGVDKYQWQCISLNQTAFPSKLHTPHI